MPARVGRPDPAPGPRAGGPAARRVEWPAELDACRLLPEVKALREALHVDAAPALELLSHPRPQGGAWPPWRSARVPAELAARSGGDGPERGPAVGRAGNRAAGVYALANRDDREIIEGLSEFLYDPSHGVRLAATEALLWTTDHRWPWIRSAVRRCLSDPTCQQDGICGTRAVCSPPRPSAT